jgi:spore coat polysaccharide biosynthesis predicted glycosyltransferase SpsG
VVVIDSYRIGPDELVGLADRQLVLFQDHDRGVDDAALTLRVGAQHSAQPGVLAGLEYACLGPDYWSLPPRRVRRRVQRVLVTTGAGDPGGLRERFVGVVVSALPAARVAVVMGSQPAPIGGVSVVPIDNVDSLCAELGRADLAITAGGQTMLEAAAAGVPLVGVVAVENQRQQALALARVGAVVLADPGELGSIEQAVVGLGQDAGRRQRLATAAQRAVDGWGALRIADRIVKLGAAT